MGEYEVERVIGRKNGVNGREYQVKWRGYPLSESTWEPENNLKTCKDLIQDYDRKIDEASKRLKVSPIESKSKSNTVWKTPVKTIKASQPKIRKVSKKTDNQQDWDMEEEEETKEVIKRTAPPLSGSHPRKSMRLSQPGGAPQAMSKRARVINDSDQEVEEEEEEEKEEQEEQAKEQAVDVEEVSPTAGKLGQSDKTTVQVVGMFEDKDGFCYKVKEKGKTQFMRREELLRRDPIALVVFYETNIIISKTT